MTRALVGLMFMLPVIAVAGCARTEDGMTSEAHVVVPQQTHAIPISIVPQESHACPRVSGASADCNLEERDDIEPAGDSPQLLPSEIPGYHPADIARAYALPQTVGGLIAIVVPFHDPAAEADLATYRAKFGLSACTVSNGCLRFIAQDDSRRFPRSSEQWSIETAVDLQIASAACPACPLLVVEASSDSLTDLTAALNQAIAQHPVVVSNSWVVPETAIASAAPLIHPGVAVVAGSGDRGTGVSWPASDPTVVAVGGTTLTPDGSTRGFTETAWSDAGFGCSALFAQPPWQSTPCGMRAIADVSALADPAMGVAIYSSAPMQRGPHKAERGWAVYGGTSVATPIVAAAIALANNPTQLSTPQYIYNHESALNYVSAGASALQAGLGSPNGIAAF